MNPQRYLPFSIETRREGPAWPQANQSTCSNGLAAIVPGVARQPELGSPRSASLADPISYG